MQTDSQSSKALIGYLMLTAVISGGMVMVVEVLGSRVIGPFFGVSLYVWTSLITVTLIALSIGYALGGLYADRCKTPDTLFYIILVSGIAVLLIPLVKAFIIKLAMPLGLRGGAFVSTLLIFGPSLFLLGCVSPFLIKIAAKELKNIGRTVGGFYALSTFGSVIGTFVTGFFLIAYLGVDKIFWSIGLMLVLLSAGYFLFFRKRWPIVVSLIAPLLLVPTDPVLSMIADDGTQIEQVFSKDSFYGKLRVVDYKFGEKHIRDFMIDGLIQGGIDMNNQLSIYRYNYFLQFLPYLLNPEGKRCLVVGLGAGLVPRWFEQQGVVSDVVDIDPVVFDIARDYFDFRVSGDSVVSDARYYLASSKKKYDYIILDVFSGDLTPGHLISKEAFDLLNHRLNAQGILAMNLIGSLKGDTYMTASIIKTLHSVFDHVDLYPTFDVETEAEGADGTGNLAVIAYNGEKRVFDVSKVRMDWIHPDIAPQVIASMSQNYQFDTNQASIVLTDDFNPIDFYDVSLREKIRKRIINFLNWEVLI